MELEAFPNYTQLTSRLPAAIWWFLRGATLLLTLFVIYLLFADADTGLVVFWKLLIPLLPLSFAVIPGLWRNICPMALLNQLPRQLGLSRENTLSDRLRKLALYMSVLGFVTFVLLRQPLLNNSGFYLGLILLAALTLALIGGLFFKGRSGWCGTFCPLAPIQKAYGHAPLVLLKNGYCESCLGCQKNCYDFNPRAAIFSDLNDVDQWWSDQRKFFIALLPGLIIGFFNSSYADTGLSEYLLTILTPLGLSVAVFYALHNLLQVNFYKLASVFAMSALAIFYWYGTPVLASGIQQILSITLSDQLIRLIQYCVPVISMMVLLRGFISEKQFKLSQQSSSQASLGDGVNALKAALSQTGQLIQVKEQSSGMQLLMQPGQSLLDALEDADLPIMPGCRMGMCGSDPVVVTEGLDNLDPAEENELNTLRRLGLEGKARLACCCKPKAGISIDLEADPKQVTFEAKDVDTAEISEQDDRLQIIIIGNGISGISTAESIREQNMDCRIILITREPYHFYNRMGLEKVLYGRTAMQGLYLMKKEWYERNDIDFWLNTQVTEIDTHANNIKLGTGELVNFDKLVLATGAKAFVPDQQGYQLPGVFTLRSAEDALSIRSWVQQHQAKRAIVLGGGVLGIEAAEALLQLGLKVSLVHTDSYLMNRQLDKKSSTILDTFLRNKGIKVFTGSGISDIEAVGDLKRVLLNDRKILVTDIILLCIGVRADVELAKMAGLDINRGVIVDEQMRSSDPNIFCVGDAAELPGAMGGLWSVGSDQGKVAADVLLGGSSQYQLQSMPAVQLKVSGIDLKSFGSFADDVEINSFYVGTNATHRWCHIRVKDGSLVGGVFINSPMAANAAINASKKMGQKFSEQDIRDILYKDGG